MARSIYSYYQAIWNSTIGLLWCTELQIAGYTLALKKELWVLVFKQSVLNGNAKRLWIRGSWSLWSCHNHLGEYIKISLDVVSKRITVIPVRRPFFVNSKRCYFSCCQFKSRIGLRCTFGNFCLWRFWHQNKPNVRFWGLQVCNFTCNYTRYTKSPKS